MDLSALKCWLFISTGPRGGLSNVWKHRRYHLHLSLSAVLPLVLALPLTCLFLRGPLVQLGGWDPWIIPWEAQFSFQGRCRECSPAPCPCATHLVCPRLFPGMYSFWWVTCPFQWGSNVYNRVSSFPLGADGSSEEDLRLDGALKIPCCTHLCSLCPTGFNGTGPREPAWLVGLRKVQKVPDWSFSLSPVERCPAGGTWAWQDCSAEFPCWMCCLQYCR